MAPVDVGKIVVGGCFPGQSAEKKARAHKRLVQQHGKRLLCGGLVQRNLAT